MQAKIIEATAPEKEIEYPCLMVSRASGNIVFFYYAKRGVVIASNMTVYPIGYYSESWDMFGFEEFKGKVILSNKSEE